MIACMMHSSEYSLVYNHLFTGSMNRCHHKEKLPFSYVVSDSCTLFLSLFATAMLHCSEDPIRSSTFINS